MLGETEPGLGLISASNQSSLTQGRGRRKGTLGRDPVGGHLLEAEKEGPASSSWCGRPRGGPGCSLKVALQALSSPAQPGSSQAPGAGKGSGENKGWEWKGGKGERAGRGIERTRGEDREGRRENAGRGGGESRVGGGFSPSENRRLQILWDSQLHHPTPPGWSLPPVTPTPTPPWLPRAPRTKTPQLHAWLTHPLCSDPSGPPACFPPPSRPPPLSSHPRPQPCRTACHFLPVSSGPAQGPGRAVLPVTSLSST